MSGPNLSPELWALAVAAKVCLLLAGATLVTRLMRRRPAAERHLVWVVAVAGVLALPLLTLLMPTQLVRVPTSIASMFGDVGVSRTPVAAVIPARAPSPVVQPTPRRAPSPRAVPAPARAPVVPSAAAPIEPALAPRAQPAPARAPGATTVPAAAPIESAVVPRAVRPDRSTSDIILFVWLAGVAGVLLTILVGFARVFVYARHARPLSDRALLVRVHGIAAELGVHRSVRLLEGAVDAMPMTFGVLRPTLLLPSSVHGWTRARQETVLRHELAHIRRRDSLTQLAAEIACALHWFNPLVWLAARRLYVEREHACDDLVLISGSRAADYAAELLDIARLTRVRRAVPLAAIAMARPSQLRRRIGAVLEERQRRAALSVRLLVPAWIGAFALMLPISALSPSLRSPARAARAAHTPAPQPSAANLTPRHMRPLMAPPVTRPEPAAALAPATRPAEASPLAPASLPAVGPAARLSLRAALSAAPTRSGLFAPAMSSPLAAAQASAQDDCLARARNRSTSINSDEHRTTIKWSGGGCSGQVEIDGQVQFDADFTTITGVSRGGSVRITMDDGRDERRIVMRSDNGGLVHDYSYNGRRAEFDAAAQRWLSSTLLMLFRNHGLMATERATAILERRGRDALLTEIGLLSSDHTRSRYFAVLVERGRLDEASLRRVLELAGNTLASDHYRNEVITAVAGHYDFTDGVRQAYIDAASKMASDHYRHNAFVTILDKGNLSNLQVAAVLREGRRLSSDHYRAQLLRHTAGRYAMTPEIRGAYLEASAGMSSDHYKAAVLTELLAHDLSGVEVARVIDATASVSNDHYRAELLSKVAAMDLRDRAVQAAFVRTASALRSDHYKQAVLQKAIARNDLDRATLLAVLDAAATMSSDHYLSSLLIDIAKRHRLDDDARQRFMKVMDRIRSSHYRGNVATALLRQERS